MIKRIKNYFKSTFVRYIVSYLVLMALLIGGLTVYMYSYYRSSVYDSTISAETSLAWQLKYSADSWLNKLNSLARLTSTLGAGETMSEISALTGEGDRRIYVYSPLGAQVYSADGVIGAEQLLGSLEYEDMSRSELRNVLFAPESFTVLPAQRVETGDGWDSILTFCMPAANGGSVICLLPEKSLLSFESASASESNRYILYHGAISARSEEFKIAESKVLEAGAYLTRSVNEVKNLQGVNYLFISMPGELEGISYVSVQPLNGIRAKAAGVWLGFVAVLLAIAIPCTLFMVLISRRNLAPILEMGKHFGKAEKEKYTDDISAIVSGIEELEGLNREIQSSSQAARRHVYARNLVTGAFENDLLAREAGAEIGLNIDKPVYAVLLVGAPRERRQDGYLDSLIALAPPNTCCVGTDLMESNQFMLICFADDENDIQEYAQNLLNEKLVKTLHLPVAVSAVHTAIGEMDGAYLEATSAYESRFLMGENRLLRFSEISFTAGKTDNNVQDYANDIKQALIEGDMDGVDKCLARLKNSLGSKNMNLFSFRQLYNDVIGAIMSQADEKNYASVEIYDLFSLSSCRSVDELEQVLRGVCESIISAKKPEEQLPLIQRVIRIMTVNYTSSDFNLSQAAELTGITPVRLTSEFKTKMGMTPMDYLTMLRMEEAKKLLRQTELSVSEVSRQSGYADASSFTRRFKQYAQVTPLQYRQSVKGGDAKDEEN